MNWKLVALLSLALWLLTVVGAGVMFYRGQASPAADGRTAVRLSARERDVVLSEMRGMLGSVQEMIGAISEDDLTRLAAAARRSGMGATAGVPPSLMLKLPLEFKRLGMTVHEAFDGLAVAAQQEEPAELILARMAQQLALCVGCHAAYRLDAGP